MNAHGTARSTVYRMPNARGHSPKPPADGSSFEKFTAGALAAYRAARSRETAAYVIGAVSAVALGLSALGRGSWVWLALATLTGSSLAFAHREALRIRDAHTDADVRAVYLGAAVTCVPFAILSSLLLVIAASLGVIAGIGWLLWQILRLLLGGRQGTAVRPRKKNTHFNVDGSPKVEYASQLAATAAASRYEHDFGQSMNTYPCADGGHYHIGHTQRKKG